MEYSKSRRAPLALGRRVLAGVALLACVTAGCRGRGDAAPPPATLVVLHAGSLARPMRAALDSFTARTGTPVTTISAGSVEAARRITELHDVPDVIALADEEVFPALLMPKAVAGYTVFARNRMVVAVAPRRASERTDSTNWFRALASNDVEVGRSNPDLDPAGYRAIMVLRLASALYNAPGLERAVLARSPERNVRPKSSDLVALLQTGALDYAFLYETSARAAGLRFIALPAAVNLGDDAHAVDYGRVSLRIAGAARGDSVTVHGSPIRYALAVARDAPHPAGSKALAGFLVSPAGLAAMRDAGLETVAPRYVPADSAVRQRAAP